MTLDKDNKKMEGHSYDGIDELDNALPTWWLNGFYLTILFAAGYVFYYTVCEGPSLLKEYQTARNEHEYSQLMKTGSVKLASEEELRAFLKAPERVKEGKAIFQSKCVACHGMQGEGGIGPNLTDEYWLHGGKMTDILNVVTNGVLDKGMPPWGAILKQNEIYSVVTYVKSLKGSNPPNAKAPQGERVKDEF